MEELEGNHRRCVCVEPRESVVCMYTFQLDQLGLNCLKILWIFAAVPASENVLLTWVSDLMSSFGGNSRLGNKFNLKILEGPNCIQLIDQSRIRDVCERNLPQTNFSIISSKRKRRHRPPPPRISRIRTPQPKLRLNQRQP